MDTSALPPRPFESPLSDSDVSTLAGLLLSGASALSGNITPHDARRVFGLFVWLMSRERERIREKVRMEDAEIGGYEYVPPLTLRENGVLSASEIVFDLLASSEVEFSFAMLCSIMRAVQPVAIDGLTFGALDRFTSSRRLLWYLRAKADGNPDPDRADRMRELDPTLRVWANTLPAIERSEWTARSGSQIKRALPVIEAQGKRIWSSWAGYLATLGYRIDNFAPAENWNLPIYEPFSGYASYKLSSSKPAPVPSEGPSPGRRH